MNKEVITEMAKGIREKMSGATLFGRKIDETDIDTMIVAVYYLSKNEESQSRIGISKTFRFSKFERMAL